MKWLSCPPSRSKALCDKSLNVHSEKALQMPLGAAGTPAFPAPAIRRHSARPASRGATTCRSQSCNMWLPHPPASPQRGECPKGGFPRAGRPRPASGLNKGSRDRRFQQRMHLNGHRPAAAESRAGLRRSLIEAPVGVLARQKRPQLVGRHGPRLGLAPRHRQSHEQAPLVLLGQVRVLEP